MAHDQCHSSVEAGKPMHKARTPHELVGAAGTKHWRGLEDLADTGEFRDFLEREFQDGASEASGASRRTFLKLMGASVALAGAATMPGCRRPVHDILPYSARVPEEIIPGKSLYYATTRPLPGGGAEGLLVETHEGRPTKVEGNPLHPVNQGKSSEHSQASILALYDPDRLKEPEFRRDSGKGVAYVPATWDDFSAWSAKHFPTFDASHGAGLAFIVDKKTSPTRDTLRDQLKKRWPDAAWVAYDAMENAAANAAITAVCGGPAGEVLDLSKAKIIVSFDRDFLHNEPLSLVYSRQWGVWRSVMAAKAEMCRLYCAESSFTGTGGSADHRVRVAPSQIPAMIVALAKKLGLSGPLAAAVNSSKVSDKGVDTKFVDAVAEDLAASKGASVVLVGASQPAWVHALVAGINSALGNDGQTVKYIPTDAERTSDGAGELAKLMGRVDRGEIKTLVCLETNPAFNAPAALKMEEKLSKAVAEKKLTLVALSVEDNETVEIANWRLNCATYLEAWGDAIAADGTMSAIQPMIAPLYAARSEIEVIATILGQEPDGYKLVRAAWSKAGAAADFDKTWRQSLWNGVSGNVAGPAMSVNVNRAAGMIVDAAASAAPTNAALDVVFECGLMGDGRWANNAWLQELPHTASKVVWDNPAYCSPSTLEALGLARPDETDKKPHGSLAEVSVGGQSMVIAVWPVPGMPDNTLVLPLGNGRRKTGQVGSGVGFNTFLLKPAGAFSASGATVKDKGETYNVSCTQTHGSMEGRAIVRSIDLPAFQTHGDEKIETPTDTYGRPKRLSLGERLEGGELNHMPANVSSYKNPFNATQSDATREEGEYLDPAHAGKRVKHAPYSQRVQWGMSIDLSACSGCNVCTVACQAENNIPVVGKSEVNKGREMHWIRVDRYFTGVDRDNPTGMVFQPVACVHCENAPCEVVCPVNATVHGPEGNNYMVYNRCIGTRYCANNCPYKVRRFNFFDFGVTKLNGGLDPNVAESTPGILKDHLPANQHLIPPRLRHKLDEIQKLQKNPNVTVRSRGVMEKCTYCLQRTNEAKIELKLKATKEGRVYDITTEGVPDGSVQTACQQACPTNAIHFGDILDPKSKVSRMREHTRTYALLGYLDTRPRTTHMIHVGNPNRKYLEAIAADKSVKYASEDAAERLKRIDHPVAEHGGHGGEGGKHEEHGHGGEKHAAFIDRTKKGEAGYRLSLAVLGGRA
jgi:molybdopterin-containing oxidoreductase family iron-sulfur binding subunit